MWTVWSVGSRGLGKDLGLSLRIWVAPGSGFQAPGFGVVRLQKQENLEFQTGSS